MGGVVLANACGPASVNGRLMNRRNSMLPRSAAALRNAMKRQPEYHTFVASPEITRHSVLVPTFNP